jgi:FdhE protein
MAQTVWQLRIARAERLVAQYPFAGEVLGFYVTVARFQGQFFSEIAKSQALGGVTRPSVGGADPGLDSGFAGSLPPELASRFDPFLSVVEQNGPGPLRQAAGELRKVGIDSHFQLLNAFWSEIDSSALPTGPPDFFARAFLQPYAENIRAQPTPKWTGPAPYACPRCKRKPGLGVLRPLGDGGQRSLLCSFCLEEWEFRRIVCPGCGEENHAKLPVYTAEEFAHVRVEACDSCRTYLKTVDLTKSGRAEPVVDEMAAIPLDLWAEKQGYAKLQRNLLQI